MDYYLSFAGVLGFALHSDGERYCNLRLAYTPDFKELPNEEKSVVDQGGYGKLTMNGAEVYKFAVNEVCRWVYVCIYVFGQDLKYICVCMGGWLSQRATQTSVMDL